MKPTGTRVMALLGACAALVGCDLAPYYEKPAAEATGSFKEAVPALSSSGWRVAEPNDSLIRGKWWELYGDPELNQLEERVAVSNQTVAQAEANYRAARAIVGEARSELLPQVSVDPSVVRSRTSTTTGNNGSNNGPNPKTTYELPFEASYEVDLWGGIRNTVAQARFSAQASAADVANALLSTQGALAQDYYALRATDEQRHILRTTLADYEASLHLVRALFNNGLASDEDLAEADTQLDSAEAQETDLGIARAQYEHAIAVLIGASPSKFSVPPKPFTPSLPTVPLVLPALLVERRPDVAAAERLVAAANANIGVARAAYFPNVSISAAAGWDTTTLSKLLDLPSRIWSLGPTLSQPVFDAGLRLSQNAQAKAEYDASVANYRQTVLSAFQAVEDNLASLRVLTKEVVQLHSAAAAAQRTVELSVVRYQNGLDSYVNVITAQNTFLTNRLAELQAELRQVSATVSLVGNLGGGWDTSQWSQTEKLALERPSAEPEVPADFGGTPVPNPPPIPEQIKSPEDILKQNEADMAAHPAASQP